METRSLFTILFVLCTFTLITGCKQKPSEPVDVEGTIVYDGEKVAGGIISLVPDGGGTSCGGAIKDGKYRVYADTGLKPGKYRVEIRWGKPTGEKNKEAGYGQSSDIIAEALPEKYHAQSILTAELKAGMNTIDFKLEK